MLQLITSLRNALINLAAWFSNWFLTNNGLQVNKFLGGVWCCCQLEQCSTSSHTPACLEDFRGASAGSPFENFWAPVCAKTNFSSTAHTSTRVSTWEKEDRARTSKISFCCLFSCCAVALVCAVLAWAAWAGPAAHWENTFLWCSRRTNIS